MKCFILYLNLSVLFSYGASLGITLQQQTLVDTPTLVFWTRDDADPDFMTFDLHFVQGNADVGLALADVEMGEEDDYGTVSVTFPTQGQYTLRAVTRYPRATVVGTSKAISAIGLNSASIPTPGSTSAPAPAPTVALTSSPTTAAIMTSSSALSSTRPLTSSLTNTADPSHLSASSAPNTPRVLSKLVRKPNTPAIVSGVIGGLVMLALFALLFVTLARRRRAIKRRLTFHKDMMVQPRRGLPSLGPGIPPTSESHASDDTVPATTLSPSHENDPNHLDVEQGLAGGIPRPLGSGHVVPPPQGPRSPNKGGSSTVSAKAFRAASATRTVMTTITPRSPISPAPLRTRRQKQLADRITMLQGQIDEARAQQEAQHRFREAYAGIASDAGHGEAYGGITSEVGHSSSEGDSEEERRRVLEDMQREMVWLRDHEQSAWAMGLTDVLPSGHARYMTP